MTRGKREVKRKTSHFDAKWKSVDKRIGAETEKKNWKELWSVRPPAPLTCPSLADVVQKQGSKQTVLYPEESQAWVGVRGWPGLGPACLRTFYGHTLLRDEIHF